MNKLLIGVLVAVSFLQQGCNKSTNTAAEYQLARKDYKNDIISDCKKAPPSANPIANDSIRKGDQELHSGNPEGAVNHYLKAIELDPNFYAGYARLGLSHKKSGNYDDAINAYLKAIEVDPEFGEADACTFDNIANAHKGKGDLNEAVKYHAKALKISPYNPVIHSNLAYTKLAAGDLDGAKSSYEKALELAPNLLYANRGMSSVMHELGNIDQSIKYTTNALRIYRSERDLRLRSLLYVEAGDFTSACRDWDEIDLQRDGSEFFAELADQYC